MRKRLGRAAGVSLARGFALVVLVSAGAACARQAVTPEPFGRLTVDQVAARLGTPGVYVYDNNPKEKYPTGHVPGAQWLDYDQVSAADLPSDKAATLIFYCANER